MGRGVTRGVGVGTSSSESVGGRAGPGDDSGMGGVGCAGDVSGTSAIPGVRGSVDSSAAGGAGSELAADATSPATASPPNEPGLTQTIFSSLLSGWYREARRSRPRSAR